MCLIYSIMQNDIAVQTNCYWYSWDRQSGQVAVFSELRREILTEELSSPDWTDILTEEQSSPDWTDILAEEQSSTDWTHPGWRTELSWLDRWARNQMTKEPVRRYLMWSDYYASEVTIRTVLSWGLDWVHVCVLKAWLCVSQETSNNFHLYVWSKSVCLSDKNLAI